MVHTPFLRLSAIVATLRAAGVLAATEAPADVASLKPGEAWRDTEGQPIQAHGGGVIRVGERFYWFGENKNGPTINDGERVDFIGVFVYSSTDLVNWKNEGLALPAVKDDPASPLHTSRIGARPKIVYNDETKR